MDEEQWNENHADMKRQGLDFDMPEVSVDKMKKKYGLRYDDMVSESRAIMEEMSKPYKEGW